MITEIKESELRAAGVAPELFFQLPINERRWVASAILRARRDSKSIHDARLIEMGNPNFTQFSVLHGL